MLVPMQRQVHSYSGINAVYMMFPLCRKQPESYHYIQTKVWLKQDNTPIELVLLMEADLLDETGALSILFDCMSSGERHSDSYEAAYRQICRFSCQILRNDPMVTPEAVRIWEEKKQLVRMFVHSLANDLDTDDDSQTL